MLYSSFKIADKKEKNFGFTVVPLIDIFYFRDTEIVHILSGTVDSNLVVNFKTPHRSGATRFNTSNTETPMPPK